MSDVKELLKGGYDLHVHSAPDCLPRKMDDIDMAERITASTLSGYAIKNHWTSTAGRAKLINRLYPGCDAIGTITLNSAVGGLNPTAVEMAARGGVKLVWFPTCDNEHEAACQFDGNPNKKLALWASIIQTVLRVATPGSTRCITHIVVKQQADEGIGPCLCHHHDFLGVFVVF